jgi:hypothetical protein
MAAGGVERNVSSAFSNLINGTQYDCKCLNCVQLEGQLEEVRLELSSMQLIVKLLYKELTYHRSASNAVGQANTQCMASCSVGSGFNTGGNSGVQNEWPLLSSDYHNSTRRQVDAIHRHPAYHIPTSNRYAILASKDTNEFYTVDNQDISNDFKLRQEKSVLRNYSEIRRKGGRNYEPYPTQLKSAVPNLNKVKTDKMTKSDINKNLIHPIPVVVNQEIQVASWDKNSVVPVDYDRLEDRHNVPSVSKSFRSLVKKPDTNNTQHRLIMLGDSHLRGVATSVKSLVRDKFKDNFNVCGLVKPGSISSSLTTTRKS